MIQNSKILIVGPDPYLTLEIRRALGDAKVVIHESRDYRQGMEIARNRRPDIALVELAKDLNSTMVFAEEVAEGSPETPVVVVYSPEVLGDAEGFMVKAVRRGVRDFLRRPVAKDDLEQTLERLIIPEAQPVRRGRSGKIISVLSTKGGVGKSTLAVNVAVGLAMRLPERVLLIDASVQMGTCHSMLDLMPPKTLSDAIREMSRLDETLLQAMTAAHPQTGLRVLAAPKDMKEANDIDGEGLSRIMTLARRVYDYVIIDTFPILDQLNTAILDLSQLIYVVMEAVVPTVVGTKQLLRILEELGYDPARIRVVVSRHSKGFAGNVPVGDIPAHLGRDVAAVIPYDRKAVVAQNLGVPMILQSRRMFSAWRRALDGVVDDIIEAGPPAPLGDEVAEPNGTAKRRAEALPVADEVAR